MSTTRAHRRRPIPARGRPDKLTDARGAALVRTIETGAFVKVAAAAAGVAESTFFRWMARGVEPGAVNAKYRQFRQRVAHAEAVAEDRQLCVIDAAAHAGDWRAAAWILERRFPANWGRKDTRPQEGGDAFVEFLEEVAAVRAAQMAARGASDGDDAA